MTNQSFLAASRARRVGAAVNPIVEPPSTGRSTQRSGDRPAGILTTLATGVDLSPRARPTLGIRRQPAECEARGGFSMRLSSRRGVRCGGLIGGVVAQHGPQHVESAAGQGQDGLGAAVFFGAFSVVIGGGGGI